MTAGPRLSGGEPRTGRTVTLDGLRGIAVIAVVIEHAWPELLPGGFAGVDVFFVLSGYLITRILVAELAAKGTIGLWAFYARRVRRILPASLVAIVGTCLLYLAVLGPALPHAMRDEALASTFSVSNFLFAGRSVDYFAADPASSPYLHFWSLAVEEQFYLVWPSLLLALAIVARHLPVRVGPWVPIVAIAVLGVGSLLLALTAPQTTAFFLLPARGWELATGGLFAWLQHRGVMRLPARMRVHRWAGVAAGYGLLAVTFAAAPELGRWPGPATVLPVVGSALLVAGGDGMPGARLLMARPLQFFGRISYALYLWHWPLLAAAVLLALPAEGPTLAVTLVAVLLAILVATASTIIVEEPIRASRIPMLAGRRAVVTGLAGMLVVGLVGVVLTTPVPAAMARADTFSAALGAARGDRERIIRDGCVTGMRRADLKDCVYGSAARQNGGPTHSELPDGPVVVLFGDSHAMHWFPAIDAWAKGQKLALVPLVRSGCPPVDAPMAGGTEHMRSTCARWRKAALDRIAALHPLLVIASGSTAVPILVDGEIPAPRREGASSAWVGPVGEMLIELRDRSQATVFLGDVPRAGFSVPDCLAVHRWAPEVCALPADAASPPALGAAEAAAADLAGVPFIDPTAWLCPDGRCTWMAGDRVGWVDEHHITSSGAMLALPSLAPLLDLYAGLSRVRVPIAEAP
jgi:peptidoglycan/LPS O-acetylase OafA/YrhL